VPHGAYAQAAANGEQSKAWPAAIRDEGATHSPPLKNDPGVRIWRCLAATEFMVSPH
jgi:hypothetical protein